MTTYHFSERIRRVLHNSRVEAHDAGRDYVGTEHVLLALLSEQDGVAHTVLESFGISREIMQEKLRETESPKTGNIGSPDLPYTSEAKRALTIAMEQPRIFNHSYVGTEHMLLALMHEEAGASARALAALGLQQETVSAQIQKLLGK